MFARDDLVVVSDVLGADSGCPRVSISRAVDMPGAVASWFSAALSAPADGDDDMAGLWRDALARLSAAAVAGDAAGVYAAADDLDLRVAVAPDMLAAAKIVAAM